MEKSEMMKKYERLIGMNVNWDANPAGYQKWLESEVLLLKEHSENLEFLLNIQNKEISTMKAKASAYDRLMSGGKKTLKEWANIFGRPVVDSDGTILVFSSIPAYEGGYTEEGEFVDEWVGDVIAHIDCEYEGEWIDDVTLPNGWEEK